MRRRAKALTVVGVLCAFFASAAAASAACPNEGLRAQQQAGFLPDCRAYEMVSPVNKNGADIAPGGSAEGEEHEFVAGGQAAELGGAVMFSSAGAFEGSGAGGLPSFYVGSRGPTAWSTLPINAHQEPHPGLGYSAPSVARTSDLSKSIFRTSDALVPEATEVSFARNLYVRDNATGALRLVTPTPVGASEPGAPMVDASADFSHVLFWSAVPQVPGAPSGVRKLYEWVDGGSPEVRLVDSSPERVNGAGGIELPRVSGGRPNAISDDGSRIFFARSGEVVGTPTGRLFLVEDGGAPLEISASQRTPVDPDGPKTATFGAVTPDGEYAFFTSSEKLTDDATTGPGDAGTDLYRYRVSNGELTDLTAVEESASLPNGAEVAPDLVLASNDGSYVYFLAMGSLADGATSGVRNLYVWHDGQITTVTNGRVADDPAMSLITVSPSGRYLAFVSADSLTDYSHTGTRQVYLYDAVTDRLRCASCNLRTGFSTQRAQLMHGTNFISTPFYMQRYVLDNGSVFFATAEALSAADTNGAEDTYRYSMDGGAQLISGGKSSSASNFYDASADGRDVFFSTRQQLVTQDVDRLVDVYDARPEGGLPSQNELPAVPACSGEACRGPGAPPPAPSSTASAAVFGPGNQARNRAPAKRKKKKAHAGKRGKRHGKSKRHGRAGQRAGKGKRAGRRVGAAHHNRQHG